MKKLILAALVSIAAVGCAKVPAGNVGVKFELYGTAKGVTGEVVGPGRYWLGINEEMYLFPTFSQNNVWTAGKDEGSPTDESITFQDKEGTQINADIGITYVIDPNKADKIFAKYRKGIEEITDVYLRNMVRDAVNSETSKMDVADIYGVGKEDLMNRVESRVRDEVGPIGINIEKIYWIGAMRLPQNITNAIGAKIEATQRGLQRENELQTARAQAEIARAEAKGRADAVLIAAEAEARANRLISESVTENLVRYRTVSQWDGKLPQVTGGATPLLNLK